MTRNILLLLCVGFGLTILSCQKKSNDADRLSYLQKFAKAQVSIERIRKKDNPDWNIIKEHYMVCSKLVNELDKKNSANYDTEITDAIVKCMNNDNVKVNQQTLAKGLQHIVVLEIRDLMHSIANADLKTRESIVNNISAVFDGIRPTFVRRDTDYFQDKKQLESESDLALAELKTSVNGDYVNAAIRLEKIINRTYALCVLYEMQAIEKLRESNITDCDVKLAEAVIFYRIIEQRIKKTDRNAHQTITAILNAEYSAINTNHLVDALNSGLSTNIL